MDETRASSCYLFETNDKKDIWKRYFYKTQKLKNWQMKTLTIFTPAYNRAHTLGRTYESLLRQTCDDFEWLIVDDGSKDSTLNSATLL